MTSSWDGTRWVPDATASPPATPRRGRRLLGAAAEALLITGLIFGLIAGTTLAAKGGNGGGKGKPGSTSAAASCVVDGTTVSATDLPTDEVINFMVTDASGTWGWVLGFSDDGTWSVAVPTRTSVAVYEFVSRTFGPDGSKYRVFASCAAG